MTPQGYALQVQGGGDLVLKPGDFQVQDDGTVLQAGEAVGHIDIVDFTDPSFAKLTEGSLYTAPEASVVQVDAPSLSQGALEASNVSTGAEMVTIMAALRSAQAGQHLMNVYDDLMGRAISSFGQV